MKKYIVIQSCGCSDSPKYCGVSSIHEFDTIEEAQRRVSEVVTEYESYVGHDIESGESYNESGSPYDGNMKYAPTAFMPNGLSAWCRGFTDEWERVETFVRNDEGGFDTVLD